MKISDSMRDKLKIEFSDEEISNGERALELTKKYALKFFDAIDPLLTELIAEEPSNWDFVANECCLELSALLIQNKLGKRLHQEKDRDYCMHIVMNSAQSLISKSLRGTDAQVESEVIKVPGQEGLN